MARFFCPAQQKMILGIIDTYLGKMSTNSDDQFVKTLQKLSFDLEVRLSRMTMEDPKSAIRSCMEDALVLEHMIYSIRSDDPEKALLSAKVTDIFRRLIVFDIGEK